MKKLLALLMVCLLAVVMLPVPAAAEASSKVAISKTKATIWVGNYTTLKVNGTKDEVKWKSSNTKIATVNKSGKVTGVAAGKATITATVNKKDYKCTITVKKESSIKALNTVVSDIKKNKNSDKICKVLSDDNVTIPYNSITSYKLVDINWDGTKDLMVWATGVHYDDFYDVDYDVVRVITVKNGKAVISGWLTVLSPTRETNNSESKLYLNKKTKSLVVYTDFTIWGDNSDLYWSMHLNNHKLNNRKSYQIGMYNGEDYGVGNDYWSATDSLTKKEYDKLHTKYYTAKDLSEIKFDPIKR